MPVEEEPEVKPKTGDEEEEEEMDPAMAAMMGFGGFGTTKVSYLNRWPIHAAMGASG
jgi:hypothetical protein